MKEYIDLGLPSGTLWASENEEGYFTFDEAKEKFGDNVPTIEEWDELIHECEWRWSIRRKGMKVRGKNGNSIFLPAAGYRDGMKLRGVGIYGDYWSSSIYEGFTGYAYNMNFGSGDVDFDHLKIYYDFSVRLVKRK